ncbi:MAG: ABC transporter ATP-binding protein [Acidimicrobiales bacterium]|nr:ABC transporter ATP-binding protein [Acidimicrobiales bacterium]
MTGVLSADEVAEDAVGIAEDRHAREGLRALDVLRRGWRASPELRHGLGGTVALALVGGAGRVVTPVLLQQMIDRGIAADEVRAGVIALLGGLGALVVLIAAAANRATQRRLASTGEAALWGLRTRAQRHLLRLGLAHHSEERRGVMVSRITSDVESVSQFLAWGGVAWLVNAAVMLAVLVAMLVYDVRLAAVAVLAVLPLGIVLRVLQRRLVAGYDQLRDRIADVLAAVSEVIGGAAVVRAYGLRQRTTDDVVGALRAERAAQIHVSRIAAVLFPSGELFAALAVAAVVVTGVALGPGGGLTPGSLIAFVFLVQLFLEPVAELTDLLDHTQTAVAGWRKVLDVLDTPVDVVEPDPGVVLPPGPPALVFEVVTYTYPPRSGARGSPAPALRGLDLVVPAGTRLAVVGATGSGKSTLARLLTRLVDPDEGRVLVAGVDLRDVATDSLRSSLVIVPQEPFLFATTVGDNVRYGRPGADDDDVRLAFVELGLEEWLAGLPGGLGAEVGERGDRLSAGERQLVALARAYVADPPCLVLDEATSAVDPATEVRIQRALESLARGRTSVVIAHRLATAERADLVAVLDEGRLVGLGSHQELVAAGGVYAELVAGWRHGTTMPASSPPGI